MHTVTNPLKNQRGMGIIELVVASAIVAVVGVSVMQITQISSKDNLRMNLSRLSLDRRQQIEVNLKNAVAWNKTLAANPSFNCFNVAPGCGLNPAAGSDGYYDFVMYNAHPDPLLAQKISYDLTDQITRISLDSDTCDRDLSNPSERCPLKFRTQWKPLCQNPVLPCQNGQIQVRAKLIHDYPDSAPFNTTRFDFSIVREFNDSSIESACSSLNGTYNSTTGKCLPKYANKNCQAIGKDNQIISSVQSDGNIACKPLFFGFCTPTTQILSGVSSAGRAVCSPRPPNPPSCTGPADCQGNIGACSATCGGGTGIYNITTPAGPGGAACPFADGQSVPCNTQACTPPLVNCQGAWDPCGASCGGGTQTYRISTPAANGGNLCLFSNGDTRSCNTFICGSTVNCQGSWSTCNQTTGTETYTINTPAQNGGNPCNPTTSGQPRNCAVNCVGSYGACQGTSPGAYKVFNITTPAMNGGNQCNPSMNGTTSPSNCNSGVNGCPGSPQVTCTLNGSWSVCGNPQPGKQVWSNNPFNGGLYDCVDPTLRDCAQACTGSWGACEGIAPNRYKTYTINQPALNCGADCAFAHGAQDPSDCNAGPVCTNPAPEPNYWCRTCKDGSGSQPDIIIYHSPAENYSCTGSDTWTSYPAPDPGAIDPCPSNYSAFSWWAQCVRPAGP